MRKSEQAGPSPAGDAGGPRLRSRRREGKQRRRWRRVAAIVLVCVTVGGIVRAFLPSMVRDYVNRTLDRNLLYEGRIGEVQLHLLRGAYSIHDVHLSQRTGNVPVPLFAALKIPNLEQKELLAIVESTRPAGRAHEDEEHGSGQGDVHL